MYISKDNDVYMYIYQKISIFTNTFTNLLTNLFTNTFYEHVTNTVSAGSEERALRVEVRRYDEGV